MNEVELITQRLYYPSEENYHDAEENIRILEFDEESIQALESGESLFFKGTGNETLVFCSENKTYEIKDVEVSNSLVLCPELLYSQDIGKENVGTRIVKKQSIGGIFHNYMERRLTFPRLAKLKQCLLQATYSGPEEEVDAENKGYYFSELLENIQCSRAELSQALKDMTACCIDGRWRSLSLRYESEVLSLIVGIMEENDSNIIIKEEVKRKLYSSVPEFIIDHILLHFGVNVEGDNFELKEDKVCRCYAEALLTAAGGTFLLDEFLKTWKASLPKDMNADLNHLRGLALIEKGKNDEDVICLFYEHVLPEDIPERFRLLFKRKEKWTYDEISPYIEKLATEAVNVTDLLTKFSTSLVQNGVRLFGARNVS